MTHPPRSIEAIRARLASVGQEHLLRFWDQLTPDRQSNLVSELERIDTSGLPRLIERYVHAKPEFALPERLSPAPYYPLDVNSTRKPWDRQQFRSLGEQALRRGKVACFTVAGGQGTRLGFNGPKGCFPAGAVTGKSLFAIFAEGIAGAERRYGQPVPWYIMTSPLNHDDTVEYFQRSYHFGLDPANIMFFPQGVMPSFDMTTGRILLAEPWQPATNPDGHGGSFKALWVSGAVADMKRRGIEHLSYFQVDNPMVRVIDPVFIGLHVGAADSSAEMSSKMLPKASPAEKVGVFCVGNGRTMIIEYSDLPSTLAEQRLDDGSLRFNAGSPAIHMVGVSFIEKLNSDPAFELPFHRAEKKVSFIDDSGDRVNPEKPNAVKLERFVFDALPFCKASIVMETSRDDEFAPIKNASGDDSAQSSARLQTRRAAAWFEQVGVRVPRRSDGEPDCTLEISPLTAWGPEDLRGLDLPSVIEPGAKLAI
ncbi:MAG: UDPGP type 1 family protein [Phycisphaeraceae bacterium]|nr:UDPGP type 1 family protein [Phycisphaeraceae bacterium]MCW5753304.1 UDPGP type 1 family protein [Phycisphaeraceae bacterium]